MSDQAGDLLTGGNENITPENTGNQGLEGSGETNGTLVVDGSENVSIPGWHDSLPKELKGNQSLVKFDSHVAVAKAFVELEGKQGGMIEKPGPNATDEEKSRFNAYLRGGVKAPTEYDLTTAKMPAGIKLGDQDIASLQELAFNNGWTREAAVASVEYVGKLVNSAKRQVQSNMRDSEAALRNDWGGEYDTKLVQAKQVVLKHGSPEFNKLLTDTGLGNHPDMARFLSNVGEVTSEGRIPQGGSAPKASGSTNFPGAAQVAREYQGE